jgi:hypothetical protein
MLEPEMEAFLRRLVPGVERQWQGASEEEIAEIEEIAGQELPRFYRWFLSTMGRSTGSLPPFFASFTVQKVLSAYDDGEVSAEPPLLFIARMDDPIMPLEVYYDLNRRARDDAFAMTGAAGDELSHDAETLREWMAWLALTILAINPSPQWCRGRLKARGGSAATNLASVLTDLGFSSPLPTGPYCCLFARSDAAFACKVDAEQDNHDLLIFNLGGPDAGMLRRLLGEISTKTDLEVSVSKWNPPLPR